MKSLALFSLCCSVLVSAASASTLSLNVVANDKSDHPVHDLSQQDFTVLIDKQKQDVVKFVAPPAARPAEIILVVDQVNASFQLVANEREQLRAFLKRDNGKLAAPTSLAFLTDSGLSTPTDASSDGNDLLNTLDKGYGLRTLRRSEGFYGAEDRATLSLSAIGGLAAFERQRPGAKTVIWISPGWALLSGPNVQLSNKEQQQIFQTIVKLSTSLQQARITLYNVNPLGAGSLSERTFFWQNFLHPIRKASQTDFGDLGLQVFAVHSGGRVLNVSNDIPDEIETCIRSALNSFLLEVNAPQTDGPDVFQPIEVKISAPGVKAQTLSGYYAAPVTQ